MTDEIKVQDAGTADKAKLTVAILVVIGGVAGYYVLAGWPAWLRWTAGGASLAPGGRGGGAGVLVLRPRVSPVRGAGAHRVAQDRVAEPPGDRHDDAGRVHLRGGGGNIFLVARHGARLGHEADHRAGELSVALRWYVVHAYSNFEHRVAESLKERIRGAGLETRFREILVPTAEA